MVFLLWGFLSVAQSKSEMLLSHSQWYLCVVCNLLKLKIVIYDDYYNFIIDKKTPWYHLTLI